MIENSLIICPNCQTENPYYNLKCKKCKFILREKFPNINLGEIIIMLIESPQKAFERIILAEIKNYLLFFLILISIRFFVLSRFISVPFIGEYSDFNLIHYLIYFLLLSASVITLLTFTSSLFLKLIKIPFRVKDVFTVLVFSFLPSIIALTFLYPIELVVFGKYLFSNNPYPLTIKENVFYILLGFEIFLISWTIILQFKSFKALKVKSWISIMIVFFNQLFIAVFLYYSSKMFL
jgi:hypothetical protein